jgi:hypothetical protein
MRRLPALGLGAMLAMTVASCARILGFGDELTGEDGGAADGSGDGAGGGRQVMDATTDAQRGADGGSRDGDGTASDDGDGASARDAPPPSGWVVDTSFHDGGVLALTIAPGSTPGTGNLAVLPAPDGTSP